MDLLTDIKEIKKKQKQKTVYLTTVKKKNNISK